MLLSIFYFYIVYYILLEYFNKIKIFDLLMTKYQSSNKY